MAAYLYVNAVLYALFALWCTVAATTTASTLGYMALTAGGRSEYLVVYGGMEWGLALMFCGLARTAAWQRLGVRIGLCLYGPIVCYRTITLWQFWPVGGLTVDTAALEVALLLWGLVLLLRS